MKNISSKINHDMKVKADIGKAEISFDTRANPRRRKESEDQPLFLRKAFAMVSNCPEELGGWSESGLSFLIKDPKEFASKVIPAYYKHNNMPSFVRQLNLYGFRKVKSDSLINSTWWEFHHPQFQKDKQHLLSDIKRELHFEENSNGLQCSDQEVLELKRDVVSMKDQILSINDSISQLSSQFKNIVVDPSNSNGASKKRRIISSENNIVQTLSLADEYFRTEDLDDNLSGFDFQNFGDLELNDDTFDALLLLDDNDISTHDNVKLQVPNPTATAELFAKSDPDNCIDDISKILGALSPDLQARFVDKLAETMGTKLSSIMATTLTVSSNAASVVGVEPPNTLIEPSSTDVSALNLNLQMQSNPEVPSIAFPLASAALMAFLTSTKILQMQNNDINTTGYLYNKQVI